MEEQDTSIEQMYYFQVLFHFSAMIFVELFSNISIMYKIRLFELMIKA